MGADSRKMSLTQHNEVDLAPVVFAAGLDLTVVFSRVRQLQIADQQRGVSVQVVAREGQTTGVVVVGVDLVVEERDDLKCNGERVFIAIKGISGIGHLFQLPPIKPPTKSKKIEYHRNLCWGLLTRNHSLAAT